jgi:hypothetical protein
VYMSMRASVHPHVSSKNHTKISWVLLDSLYSCTVPLVLPNYIKASIMRASLCALALSCFGKVAGQSLTAALSNTVFLNEGVVTSTDERVWVNIPTMYLEAENVTCAQCSWGTSSYPYMFYKNGTAPVCQPQTPNPGHDAPGSDFTATPLAQDSSSDCEALCCSQASCTAWTYVPSAPSVYFDCQAGQHCCYQKSGNPPFTNSTIPGIISGYITQPLDAFVVRFPRAHHR